MKVIINKPNVHYLGYCVDDAMYHFSCRDGSREAYSQVKIVDQATNDVYYCAPNGEITLKFEKISDTQLKSAVNTPEVNEVVARYQQYLDLLFAR